MPRPERPLDPADGVVERFAHELRTLRRDAGSPAYRELAKRAHYSMTTLAAAARGDRLPSWSVTSAYVRACGGDPDVWEPRWRAAADAVNPTEAPRPPYLGLATYGSADRDVFFGREELVARVIERLGSSRFVAVVGASGSGKSSLLRAGVVPALPVHSATLLVTPGRYPATDWSVRLADLLADGGARGHVVVVDQFEELFTQCDDDRERADFVARLVDVVTRPGPAARLVVGLRADFYGHCLELPGFATLLENGHVTVTPVTTEHLREIVTRPAQRVGCTVDVALLTRVLAEASDRTAVLPLVSHALLETWRRRRGSVLTLEAYEAAGGVRQAIAHTAESTYRELTAEEQQLARLLFLRLIAIGEAGEVGDTKRRVGRDELDVGDPVLPGVLERLAQARLVTIDAGTVELVHEALIRSWPRLRTWCADDRAGMQIHRRLTLAAKTWESVGREPAALHRGSWLAAAGAWAATAASVLSKLEHEFLAASLAEQRRERSGIRQRRRLAVIAVLLLIVTVLVGVAARAAGDRADEAARVAAERQRVVAEQRLVARAAALRETDPGVSARLGLAAYRLSPNTATRSALLETWQSPLTSRLTAHGAAVTALGYSADGRLLATAGRDGMVRLWDPTESPR